MYIYIYHNIHMSNQVSLSFSLYLPQSPPGIWRRPHRTTLCPAQMPFDFPTYAAVLLVALPARAQTACPQQVLLLVYQVWYWLVVSAPLKNIRQLGSLFPIYGKTKNVPNHQPGYVVIHANHRTGHADCAHLTLSSPQMEIRCAVCVFATAVGAAFFGISP